MLPETHALIDSAERRTGRPVHVLVDPDLPTSASIQIARHGAPAHIVRVRTSDEASDYLIARQILFMLRMVELPTTERFDFAPTGTGDRAMGKVVRPHVASIGLSDADSAAFAAGVTKWILMDLRSRPVGMRVDQQIFRDMPALRGSFEAGAANENDANLKAMQRMQGLIRLPERYYWPSTAYALFADRLLGTTLYSVPFDAMGFAAGGHQLLRTYDGVPSDASRDRSLVDAWGREIAVSDWYRWIPYDP